MSGQEYELVPQEETSISEVDGILSPLDSPRTARKQEFIFNRLSVGGVSNSSFTSIDFCSIQVPPKTEDEAISYLKDISHNYKKVHLMKTAFEKSCFASDFNDTSFSPINKNTILHLTVLHGDTNLLPPLLAFAKSSNLNINLQNAKGDTPLHLAVEHNQRMSVEQLLKVKPNTEIFNNLGFTPVQIAALKQNGSILKLLIRQGGVNRRVLTPNTKETLIHLSCRAMLMRKLNLQEENERKIQRKIKYPKEERIRSSLSHDSVDFGLYFEKREESRLIKHGFSILHDLLHDFMFCPDLVEVEDVLETSPGLILHYFCVLDFQEGVKRLFVEPFDVDPNVRNKNGFTALWVATWSNHINCAQIILKHRGNPNISCSNNGFTPLHLAVLHFHEDRVKETCELIDHLIECGANLKESNSCGETAAHLAVQTGNFQVISKFVSALGPELLDLKEGGEDSESSFFMYAVGRLDEKSIYQLIKMGAPLITHSVWGENNEGRIIILSDSKLPLQEAIVGGNSDNYFNALLSCNLNEIRERINDEKTFFVFLCCHLLAAAKDLRSDVVRMIFHHVEDIDELHSLLLFKDATCIDETFTKTALQWAVENNDRLCTTEILHQEYQCHKYSKDTGLRCLRGQLKGDELLSWTIETFTVFYERTVAQKCVIPLMAIVPVFFSIFNFTYDYYSDISLTLQYFSDSSFRNTFLSDDLNQTLRENQCRNFTPTPHQYFIAFAVNLICITAPLLVFYFMCAWEMNSALQSRRVFGSKILALFLSIFFTPFFVLYVAGRQLYYKFRHARAKQKNVFRDQLRKSEFFWGITRSAEAGLESCGQLVLQIWLLSFNFYSLLGLSFEKFLKKSLHGVVLILSFSIKEADEIEQSLGKVFLSVISLVFSVSSGYRMLKRGSLRINNSIFIYLSTFFQVTARICCVSLFFVGVRDFSPIIPVLLLVHFILILLLKLIFENDNKISGSVASTLVLLLTVFASSMVYVRITPLTHRFQYEHRSTFVVQFLFFVIVFIENVLLSITPVLFYDRESTLLSCLSPNQFNMYFLFIVSLSICAWICHIFYYKCMGHPWADINGPGRDPRKKECHIYYQFCGKEKKLVFNYGKSKKNKRLSSINVDFI